VDKVQLGDRTKIYGLVESVNGRGKNSIA